MRVTGGAARGRRLKRPPKDVRPTSDVVREAIFDVLAAQEVDMTTVLDLYAGSGALGIEALSRGGATCDFVDRVSVHTALIKENLRVTEFEERGRVHTMDVKRAPERLEGPYTLVLADPPYDDDAALPAIDAIASSALVGPETALVLEHSQRREVPERLGRLGLTWSRRYGDSQVSIYKEERS